ncbi:alpha/beta fold hydrolase [Rhodovulum sp. DZ06]|uniref:alpha/beta fold hydrolase n=1 Tax=Rhodovulum sp. DZ06 TaxID=3425126 RepID=UPI003D344660
MRSETIEANGLRFHTRVDGPPDAPLLLLLHGFPEYSGGWADIMPLLAERYFCVAPDQRGYGRSDKPEGAPSYTGGKLARDAAAIIAHYRPEGRAFVFGHDWGASVAYALAIAAPELVEKLVIANGVHPIPFQKALAAGGAQTDASQYITWLRREGSEDKLLENDCALLRRMFAEGMDMSWFEGETADAYIREWSRPGALKAMVNWYRATPLVVPPAGEAAAPESLPDLPADAMRIAMPHLLIWGANDTALRPEARDGIEALCDAGFEMVEFPDADHWILHQQPGAVAREVKRFLG